MSISQTSVPRFAVPLGFEDPTGKSANHTAKDIGPFYLFSPGDAIHRPTKGDGLLHVYPNRLTLVKNCPKWYMTQQVGEVEMLREETRRDAAGNLEEWKAIGIYAGTIVETVLSEAPNEDWGRRGAISLQAFARLHPDDVDVDGFNNLINPIILATDPDDVPDSLKDFWYECRASESLRKTVEQNGIVAVRLKAVRDAKANTANPLYLRALDEIERAFGTYIAYAHSELDAADSRVTSNKNDGIPAYDNRARQLMTLINRKGLDDVATRAIESQNKPLEAIGELAEVLKQQAQGADVERKPCPRCAEMIPIAATFCRFCSLTVKETAQPKKKAQEEQTI